VPGGLAFGGARNELIGMDSLLISGTLARVTYADKGNTPTYVSRHALRRESELYPHPMMAV